jgi:hypothetical protein
MSGHDPEGQGGGVGALVAAGLVGGIVGLIVAIAVTSAILSGEGANALEWAVTFIFICFFAIPLGIGAALGLSGHLRDRRAKRPQ